jgi:hypothetical protein
MQTQLRWAYERLRSSRVDIQTGLSTDEFLSIEQQYRFTFPPDLRWALRLGMPASARFPNWRQPDGQILSMLSWPFDGIAFDIRMNHYWRSAWGVRPPSVESAVDIAMNYLRQAPVLIPIYAHVYVPSYPHLEGNPIFSVYQTDIIHRGEDLAEYLLWLSRDESQQNEEPPVFSDTYRYIPFWTDMARENNE